VNEELDEFEKVVISNELKNATQNENDVAQFLASGRANASSVPTSSNRTTTTKDRKLTMEVSSTQDTMKLNTQVKYTTYNMSICLNYLFLCILFFCSFVLLYSCVYMFICILLFLLYSKRH
jgi:hypothetical protein